MGNHAIRFKKAARTVWRLRRDMTLDEEILSEVGIRRSCGFVAMVSSELLDVHKSFFTDLAQPGVEFFLILLLPDVPCNLVSSHLG